MKPTYVPSGLKRNYIIPCFQREYAWGGKEIEDLVSSITKMTDDFCLGIVTIKRSRSGRKLIDGQQRLTTLYLIAIHCGLVNSEYDIKLTSEYEDFTDDNSLNNILKRENEEKIPQKMKDGFELIEKLIPETEKMTVKKNLEKVYYYEINLNEKTDLNHYFEVMNSRGVQLSRSDIVKSLLINKLDSELDKRKLNQLWYKLERMDQNLNLKTFAEVCAKTEEYKTINEILEKKKASSVNSDQGAPEEENSILNFEFFLLYTVRVYDNLDDDELDSSGDFNLNNLVGEYENLLEKQSPEEVLAYLDFLIEIKNIYDNYIVRYDSENEEWSLKNGSKDMILIQSCLRVSYTNRRVMHWIYITLKFFYKNRSADAELYVDTMRNYVRKQVAEYLEFGKSNDYRTGFATPNIVLNYLDFLILKNYDAVQKEIPEAKGLKINDLKFKFRNSIEHFMPRHGEDGKENPAWVDDFGNLALLAYRTNTRIQNEDPKGKAQHFEREGLSGYSLKLQIMAKFALSSAGWDKEQSDLVTKTMIRLLEDDVKKLAL